LAFVLGGGGRGEEGTGKNVVCQHALHAMPIHNLQYFIVNQTYDGYERVKSRKLEVET